MGHLTDGNRAAAGQGPGQLQSNGEGPGLIQQHLGLKLLRQGAAEGIEESNRIELLQLAQTRKRRTPNQLERVSAQGKNRKGPLRAKQLPGLIWGGAAQTHLHRQTALSIGQGPLANASSLAGRGAMAIGRHHQIHPQERGHRSQPKARVDRRLVLHRLQQHSHQILVLQDPAHGLIAPKPREISCCEGNLQVSGPITEFQAAKGRQGRHQGIPKPKPLQQTLAGMGQGVGPVAFPQCRSCEGIAELHLPARIRQGQGAQRPGRTGAIHPSAQGLGRCGAALGHGRNGTKKPQHDSVLRPR